jgi:hypothetical protein
LAPLVDKAAMCGHAGLGNYRFPEAISEMSVGPIFEMVDRIPLRGRIFRKKYRECQAPSLKKQKRLWNSP